MGGDGDIDTWRRDRLADEPIYCAVPTPANPDDAIFYGSDEELDDAAKVAKRLRYEEEGLRYLRGEPLRLLSTSLRGPFDKASGWKNPWLPESPSVVQPNNKMPLQPMNNTPAIKKKVFRAIKLRALAENATAETDSSMRCHLPSPESNRGFDLLNEYLDSEKHGRIEAWARGVSDRPLEKDQFWAPEKATEEANGDATRKRPAAQEWLRKKSTKRTRPNNTHSTGAASTPTPMLASKSPVKAVPASIHDVPCNKQKASQTYLNRSFELTTPSSTADQRPANPVSAQLSNPSTNNDAQWAEELATFDEATVSLTSSDVSTASIEPPASELRSKAETHDSPAVSSEAASIRDQIQEEDNHNTPPAASRSETESQESGNEGGGAHEDNTLESFLDQSFHYRARLPKQEIHTEDNPNVQANDSPPRITESMSTEAQDHNTRKRNPSAPAKEQDLPTEMAPERKSTAQSLADGSPSTLNIDEEAQCSHNSIKPDHSVEKCSEREREVASSSKSSNCGNDRALPNADPDTARRDEMSSNLPSPIAPGETRNIDSPLATYSHLKRDHIAADENLITPDIQPQPKRICLEQSIEYQEADHNSDIKDVGEHSAAPDLAMNEGTTLVGELMDTALSGDLMNVDNPLIVQPTEHPGLLHPMNPASSDADILSKASSVVSRQPDSIKNEILEDSSVTGFQRIILPLSQMEWGIVEPRNMPPKPASDYESDITNMDVKRDPQDTGDDILVEPTEPDQSHGPQNPWIPEGVPANGIEIKNEPTWNENEAASRTSSNMSSLSPRRDEEEPAIRASQQSPWIKDTGLPPVISVGVEECKSGIADIEPNSEPIAAVQYEQHNPDEGINVHITISPIDHSSTLPVPADDAHEQNADIPDFPRSMSELRNIAAAALAPSTPAIPEARPSTPEQDISIKSFAKFNTPSPLQRRSSHIKRHSAFTGRRSGILINTTPSNPWSSSAKSSSKSSSRRVSFAPLPGEEADYEDAVLPMISARAASPPPPESTVEVEDEDFNDTFHRHFDAVKRRGSGINPPQKLRIQPRLLPSLSQQRPASPGIGAMAAAFQEADALAATAAERHAAITTADIATENETLMRSAPADEEEEEEHDTADADAGLPAMMQSPWEESQGQGQGQSQDDYVAAVMGNLDQYLDAWDVDDAMRQASFDDPAPGAGQEDQAVEALRGVGVWDY